jgi:hypothetical protein
MTSDTGEHEAPWGRCVQCMQALLNGFHPDGSHCSQRANDPQPAKNGAPDA